MEGPQQGASGLRRLVNATRYSVDGLLAAARNEVAFRQELVLAAVFVPLGLALGSNGVQRALLVGSVLLVAIEATVDRVSEVPHPLAKRAKDMGSAAVMLSLLAAAAAWLLVLL